MVLSEAEAERRLAALRREREALDRAITDLSLYLELGRRLTTAPLDEPARHTPPLERHAVSAVRENEWAASATSAAAPHIPHHHRAAGEADRIVSRDPGPAGAAIDPSAAESVERSGSVETKPAGTLSEGALARRYGRALIREAVAVLEEAARPLHASEILSALAARGFSVPGQQDPVAALNTRLWKRAGEGGPLRRLGDAMYAPAEERVEEG